MGKNKGKKKAMIAAATQPQQQHHEASDAPDSSTTEAQRAKQQTPKKKSPHSGAAASGKGSKQKQNKQQLEAKQDAVMEDNNGSTTPKKKRRRRPKKKQQQAGANTVENEEEQSSEEDNGGQIPEDEAETGNHRSGTHHSKHRSQLESLQHKDPEFFQFLQNTDSELLNFNESDDDVEDEDEADTDEEEQGDRPQKSRKGTTSGKKQEDGAEDIWPASDSDEEEVQGPHEDDESEDEEEVQEQNIDETDEHHEDTKDSSLEKDKRSGTELTSSLLVPKLKEAFSNLKLRALQDVLHAFRAACKSSVSEGQEEESARYRILSSTVFNRVVVTVLTNARAAFVYHLNDKKGNLARTGFFTEQQLRQSKNWKRVSPLIQSFLVNLGRLLPEVKNPQMLLFLLRTLKHYIPFFGVFPKLSRKLVKSLLNFWSKSHAYASDEDVEVGIATGKVKKKTTNTVWSTNVAQNVMNVAFLRLRQCALELPYPTIDACLKGMYLGYVRTSKFMNESNRFWLTQMGNAVVEIFGLDKAASYQHAFVYIRQLALSLRSALVAKTENAVRNVASWQFVNCCKLWAAMMTAYAKDPEHPLFTLSYPLVQIILGSLRIASTPRYWYMRLHLIKALNDIQWATGVYIPVAIPLLDMLRSAPLQRKPSGSSVAKPPSFDVTLKISDAAVSSRVIQNFVVEKAISLLGDHLKANSASVAFPELALPIQLGLRAFAKKTKINTWRHCARDLVDWSVKHATRVANARSESQLSPSNVSEIAAFQHASKGQSTENYLSVSTTIGDEYKKLRESRLRLSHGSEAEQPATTSLAGNKRAADTTYDEETEEQLLAPDEDTPQKQKSQKKKRKKRKGGKVGKESLQKEDVVSTLNADDL
eukprot:gb/GECG01007538.1/.p1 GENE.gb/GECG01007538.1/~~gb/GECG01007538.1/.p1  ORF type:complete len:874 (+),score=169.47 gb/GECG01007538.1/:1-2622(+)